MRKLGVLSSNFFLLLTKKLVVNCTFFQRCFFKKVPYAKPFSDYSAFQQVRKKTNFLISAKYNKTIACKKIFYYLRCYINNSVNVFNHKQWPLLSDCFHLKSIMFLKISTTELQRFLERLRHIIAVQITTTLRT